MKRTLILLTLSTSVLFVAACGQEAPTRTTSQLTPEAGTPAVKTPAAGVDLPTGTGRPSPHAPTKGSSTVDQVDVSGVEKAEGGLTVGELFAGKADLSGKEVTLRAKVVKFTPRIMGKNWLHLQDGSGDADARTHDLTVTTDVTAKVGDTVLVSGAVVLDKDFGAGYKYDLIIEDAKVTVE